MISDQLENYEDQVRSDLINCDQQTLDYMAKNMDVKSLLVVYARDGFEAACDFLANEYEGAVSMLAAEREAEANGSYAEEQWLDNRDRARDMNAERA
jgi:hypothetical protein